MIKGWKFFDKNLMCRGVQFKVGETFEHEGEIELSKGGFHFYEKTDHITKGYSIDWRVCEIDAFGVISDLHMSVCRSLKVVRELTKAEKVILLTRRKESVTVYDWLQADSEDGDILEVISCRCGPLALQNERTREVCLL